jgi:hypothetical protein
MTPLLKNAAASAEITIAGPKLLLDRNRLFCYTFGSNSFRPLKQRYAEPKASERLYNT